MSVLLIARYDLRPDKAEAYAEWVKTAMPTLVSAPGLIEIQGYQSITATHQAMVTYSFADLASFTIWRAHRTVDATFVELRQYVENMSIELWGPSPIEPKPHQPTGYVTHRWPNGDEVDRNDYVPPDSIM